ncbi:hypothetical protein F4861DRAFT_224876 [Xylaria intraflava]|nr:hypothetical protein F4861DRAFT_224876 [Xylaria intraflava]
MPQASGQKPCRRQPRPPKLRSACNQCNAAKVKCSGERDGCARCKALQTSCLYVESRVGKVQGPRLRQRKQAAQNISKDSFSAVQQASSSDVVESHTIPDTPSNDSFTTGQHPHSWSESWDPGEDWAPSVQMSDGAFSGLGDLVNEGDLALPADTPADRGGRADDGASQVSNDARTAHDGLRAVLDVLASSSENCSTSPATLQVYHNGGAASPSLPANITQDYGFGLPVLQSPPTITPPPTQKPQHVAAPQLGIGDKDLAKLNSRCALACTHIIATLESYLLLELKALDLILEVTRKARNELEKLVHLQKEPRSSRCIILFSVALSQIIELLEIGTKQLPDSEAGLNGRLNSGLPIGLMPSLGFGAFSFVAEQQVSFRLSLIRRECRHVTHLAESIEALATTGMLEQSLKGLKERLQEMCDGREESSIF